MTAAIRRGRRFHRATHRLGLAAVAPLLILAAWAAIQGMSEPDLYERNEIFGVAIFAPVAALALYGLLRAIGFFLIELFD